MPVTIIEKALDATSWSARLALAACCSLPAAVFAAPSGHQADLECVIRATANSGDFVRLDAVVKSDQRAEGQYAFSLLKRGPSGATRNEQSGAFTVAGEGDQVLTTVVLDASALDHYRARLSVESNRGKATCTSP